MMLPTRPLRSRAGFTLLEVVLALVLLGGSGLMFAQMLVDDTRRARGRDASEIAQQIALNELERLRATHPWAIQWTGNRTRFRVDRYGNHLNAALPGEPVYVVEIERAITCDGGVILRDNRDSSPYMGGCESVNNQRPTANYTLRVRYPSPLERDGIDQITHRLKVGPVGRFASHWTPATAP